MKQNAAKAAIKLLTEDTIIGIGTGTTVHFFIEELAKIKHKIAGTVASSTLTKAKLQSHGIPVYDLNTVDCIPLYIDSADEITPHLQMIKGGGGALVREKILASVAEKFVCIIDPSKQVDMLGSFPVAVEVIPMARSHVGRQLVKLGGDPQYREQYTTDNGNIILDVYNFNITDPHQLEFDINQITGVVDNGIFAIRKADLLIVGSPTIKV